MPVRIAGPKTFLSINCFKRLVCFVYCPSWESAFIKSKNLDVSGLLRMGLSVLGGIFTIYQKHHNQAWFYARTGIMNIPLDMPSYLPPAGIFMVVRQPNVIAIVGGEKRRLAELLDDELFDNLENKEQIKKLCKDGKFSGINRAIRKSGKHDIGRFLGLLDKFLTTNSTDNRRILWNNLSMQVLAFRALPS